jgi:ligand-binding SRPBCC domain-containing protein
MKIYQLKTIQNLLIGIDEAWEFFSNPNNLKVITPGWLNFKVTSELPNKMYAGMIINYKVHPVLGIPNNWVTEITHVEEPFYFVDEQRFGPYKLWHHQHHFRETENGVEMTDIINYALPFDPFSRPINSLLVERRVKEIFKFREKKLGKLFPSVNPSRIKLCCHTERSRSVSVSLRQVQNGK